ncbi:MAG: hypothetical protein JWO38_2058 [Gemmataceae bacterium]|nr:hypothetical protein [Gemmataceae bacterium]
MKLVPALTWLIALGSTSAAGCSSAPPPAPAATSPAWFEDVTDRVGINFVVDPGPVGSYRMPQIVGTGCAVFDCDGDSRLDLYLMHNVAPDSASRNRLYRQRPDGTFEDASAGSGLDFAGPCMGAAVGDVDNDGRPDLLVTLVGGVRLFLNLGGGKFADASAEAGIRNPGWATSAAFLDYNRDGRLDLFVVNYVDYDPSVPCLGAGGEKDFCSPKSFPGTVSRLFRNRGPVPAAGGRPAARVGFEDVSVLSGVGTLPGPGLGVYCADLTGDGWPDVFVANDGAPNRLWVNQRDGTFKDEAASRGVAYTIMGQAFAGMGVAAGDLDNDGLVDMYVTHLSNETNTLWKQGPRGMFSDRTAESGLPATDWRGTGFGTAVADFDHDGWSDLALVNGRVVKANPEPAPGLPGFWAPYAQRNQLLANTGGGRFKDVSAANPAFSGRSNVGRGLACGDLDGDGAVDLVVTATAGPARVYRNVCPDRGHWLQVRVVDPRWNRDAYGAEVTVTAAGQRRLRVVTAAGSYLCSSSPVVHFGLGPAAAVDAVEVTWPDGLAEQFPGCPADRALTLRRGEGARR